EGRRLSIEQRLDERTVETVAERLDAKTGEMARSLQPVAPDEVHESEAANVVVGDAKAVRQVEDDMVMGLALAAVQLERARLAQFPVRRRHQEAPAHAEMHDQDLAGGQIGQKIF